MTALRITHSGVPTIDGWRDLCVRLGRHPFFLWNVLQNRNQHYTVFEIPKMGRDGKPSGVRYIEAPHDRLRRIQKWILHQILDRVHLADEVTGFRRGRSTRSHAAPHADSAYILHLDIKDFFPSVARKRVYWIFRDLGYKPAIAHVLADYCSYKRPCNTGCNQRDCSQHPARLPQGAPSSPALANIACARLDRRIRGLAKKHGLIYTRYADDVAISGKRRADLISASRSITRIMESEGFQVQPKKTRLHGPGSRRKVTGLLAGGENIGNDPVRLGRKYYYALRRDLFLFHIHSKGDEKVLGGKLAYVRSVDPNMATALNNYRHQLQAKKKVRKSPSTP